MSNKKYRLIKQHEEPWTIDDKEIEVGDVIATDQILNGVFWCTQIEGYFEEVKTEEDNE